MTSVSENNTTDLNFRQMDRFSGLNHAAAEPLDLPPGFRFHPTDEELITHYLCPKALDGGFSNQIVGEVDLNQVEPWDLPGKARMGEKEWYFFCVRDRKYPTGSRTNRATVAGYWKATGKDREIFRGKVLVGMKKTLVFYRGRAPRGEKTGWVMHEYRLVGKNSMHSLPKTAKKDWVICRVFKKGSGGQKVDMSGLAWSGDCGGADWQAGSCLPPLMDLSGEHQGRATEGSDHVTCFSNSMEDPPERLVHEFSLSSNNVDVLSRIVQLTGNLDNPSYVSKQEDEFLQDAAISSYGMGFDAYQDQGFPVISSGQVGLDCLWNY